MPLLSTIGAAAARAFGFLRSLVAGGYSVANSARFNSGSSDYLNRTPASTTNQKTWTYSFWIKRTVLGTTQYFLYARNDDNNRSYFRFNSTDTLGFFATSSASVKLEGTITSRVFRDVSAWYHIVLSADTTQATSSNRFKIYVNGTEQTLTFDTTPSQNSDLSMNIAYPTAIGVYVDGLSGYLNGYMSEVYMIDGQQLTPSSFGETDETTGIWKPKAYTGTYGTNGFYLDFEDSANLGNDVSGNNNDFTVNNLTSIDQSYDSPTNNFATFNSIKFTGGDLTQGNLELDSTSGSWKTRNSTIGVSAGKWFMEFKMGTILDDQSGVAIVSDLTPDGNMPGSDATRSPAIGYNSDGGKWVNGSKTSSYFSAMSSNDIIGIALDMDGGTVQFYRNGSTTGSPINLSDAFTSSNYPLFFVAAVFNTRDVQANFGYPPFTISSGNADANGFGNFEYAVPSGYYALCSKNLALYG